MHLSDTEKNLLRITTIRLIEKLQKDKTIAAVQEMGFDGYSEENEEDYQVQIIVTRSKRDFIEPMVTLGINEVN